jgi:hypothetical protein
VDYQQTLSRYKYRFLLLHTNVSGITVAKTSSTDIGMPTWGHLSDKNLQHIVYVQSCADNLTCREISEEEAGCLITSLFKCEVSKRDLIRHPVSAAKTSRQVKLFAHDCNKH